MRMVDLEDPTNDELMTLNDDDIEGIELVEEAVPDPSEAEGATELGIRKGSLACSECCFSFSA